MIRLAANLSFLFTELPFLDRFESAARAGFDAVEFAFAYDIEPALIRKRLRENDLKLVVINTPPGDMDRGELGLAALPGRERDAAIALQQALEYAVSLEASFIHLLAGIPPDSADAAEIEAVFQHNMSCAADQAEKANVMITLEPLNQRDRPGYYLRTNAQAHRLISESSRGNIKLQFDLYHAQITEGDLTRSIEKYFDVIGHVQIAGVPDRSEPSFGEVAHLNVLSRIEQLGYQGHVGCEYIPAAGTLAGLAWAAQYLK